MVNNFSITHKEAIFSRYVLYTFLLYLVLLALDLHFFNSSSTMQNARFHKAKYSHFSFSIFAHAKSSYKDSPYSILGIDPSATVQEIKSSYRALVKKFHPDLDDSPKAAENFSRIREAYDILSDDNKRKVYDSEGYEGLERLDKYGDGHGMDPSDFFPGFFPFKTRKPPIEKAKPIILPVFITLEDLYFGTTLHMKYRHQKLCDKLDSCLKKDAKCVGSKVRSIAQQLGPGLIVNTHITDESCVMQGKSLISNCKACPNGIHSSTTSNISIFIEPGMKTGDKIIFEGKGQETVGMENGDIILIVNDIDHDNFTRIDDDLETTIEIDLKDALIGFDVKFKNVDKTFIQVSNTDVTFDGQVFKFPSRGMPKKDLYSSYGDLYIKTKVRYPTTLTDQQKELVRMALENN